MSTTDFNSSFLEDTLKFTDSQREEQKKEGA